MSKTLRNSGSADRLSARARRADADWGPGVNESLADAAALADVRPVPNADFYLAVYRSTSEQQTAARV